jgi:hypothetical protein
MEIQKFLSALLQVHLGADGDGASRNLRKSMLVMQFSVHQKWNPLSNTIFLGDLMLFALLVMID